MSTAVSSTDASARPESPGFGIYVHWPFCLAKCPYCDFNSHVRAQVDQDRWRGALVSELEHYADLTGGRRVTSIFFGGGTPSLMPPDTVDAVIDRVRSRWPTEADLEITLEANPTSVEAGRFAALASAGVNRVSLGVQALDDADLRLLGRQHSVAEALQAVELAGRLFPRHSFDLIYARPGQSVAAWEAELRRALSHTNGHLSVYQLTIEPGTQFHTLHQRGALVVPEEGEAADLFEATQAMLRLAGLPAYEISNHARPGEECRHNLTYWRYGDYVGVGPGAHGRVTLNGLKYATRAHRAPEVWLERVERHGHGSHDWEQIEPDEQVDEAVMMGLRLTGGIPRGGLSGLTGRDIAEVADPAQLKRLIEGGFIELTPDRLRATDAGRQRLNAVLSALLAAG